MANRFSPGQFVGASWAASGNPFTALAIKSHSFDLSCLLFDVTHSATGGIRARLAGPLDAAGTVEADLDLDLLPWSTAIAIVPGARGVALFGVSAIAGIQIPSSVEKIHGQSAMENEVKYSFDAKMNALAGLLVYPTLA